jgi:hypothetical protein
MGTAGAGAARWGGNLAPVRSAMLLSQSVLLWFNQSAVEGCGAGRLAGRVLAELGFGERND